MRTRAKGNRVRRKAIELLEQRGFEVGIVERTGRFIFPKDLFGLFDLIAICPEKIHLLQITCNKPHAHAPLKAFAVKYPNISVVQLVWRDREGFNTIVYDNFGGKKEYVS